MTDREFTYLTSLGYTGSLADKRRAYYDDLILNGGTPDIPILAEYAPSRDLWTSSAVPCTSQRLQLTYFTAKNTETITSVTAYSGSTAAGATPTVCQYAIYSVDSSTENLTLLASTANDTALFASTNTAYLKTLDTPFSKVSGSRYAVAVLVVTAAATPTFVGQVPSGITPVNTRFADKPRLAGYLASQTSIPSSVTNASLTASAIRPAFYLS